MNLKKYKIKIYKTPFNFKKTIFCIKRKKFLLFNYEEILRQKIILYLIHEKNYNLYNIEIEKIIYNQNKIYIIDIFVKTNNILIECKSPNKKLTKNNIYQLFNYSNYINIKYFILTNGIENIFLKKKLNNIKIINDIPYNKKLFF
ncbi:type I restriction enzyme HsdR N-terminal domain-containing protein [Candidatus Shikimatogenerans bostrichidophilus]|uniref:type I restriction enzyme HsdR N-terminal domain-containing protein n=1 Tax=Candidatus Shikimatogenerans bostrichidophilus TaxID=2943807 RepID=UPI002965DECF